MNRRTRRDRSLLRLAQGTRWMAAGALALAGAMSAAVAVAKPGHSKPMKATVTSTATTTLPPAPTTPSTAPEAPVNEPIQPVPQTTPTTATPTTATPTTLSPPTAPPQTTSTAPVVTSGGS